MKKEVKKVSVYECFFGKEKLMGTLCCEYIRGDEIFSFKYNDEWLASNSINMLDPDLLFYSGFQYTSYNKKQFGIFLDSEPDRWGKKLMQRRENILSKIENRPPKILSEMDYLLGVEDFSRMGAIRFSLDDGKTFENNEKSFKTPPITKIRDLEAASIEYEKDNYVDKWIKMLIAPGSSLGGARPKANVIDTDGSLWIAKFPSKSDTSDIGAWEYVMHELALLCSINVPDARCIRLSKNGTTYLSKRFDREKDKRIHFASAMTLLGKKDGESSECSYLDLIDFIKKYGSNVKEDLLELFKRVAFFIAVKNTDDHLRNHGFLLSKNGWRLSPLYDVNPNSDGRTLSLSIDGIDNSLSIELLLKTAEYYELTNEQAECIVKEITNIVKNNWEKLAKKYEIVRSFVLNMNPASDREE